MIHPKGYFGPFGGRFIPQILMPALRELEEAFFSLQQNRAFNKELTMLLQNYAGRPTPLYECRRLPLNSPAKIFLKREDLLHGGAHKTNQVIAQGLLAKYLNKTKLIAETGAGQHGVATAMVGALLGLETRIFMGAKDVERQSANVNRMKIFGATVIAVEEGEKTLKEAVNAALREWSLTYQDTHYVLGSVVGPHPYPLMVREFQRIIGQEAKTQIMEQINRLPDTVIACVGGGSNALGIFFDFIENECVSLIGVEAGGQDLDTKHCATIKRGKEGIFHGTKSIFLQTQEGQIQPTHSIAAGLDYPGVGPEHAFLHHIGRAQYLSVSDDEAIHAFHLLSKFEGIIPALESSHALAMALKLAEKATDPQIILVNLSGRGDKDIEQVMRIKQNHKG